MEDENKGLKKTKHICFKEYFVLEGQIAFKEKKKHTSMREFTSWVQNIEWNNYFLLDKVK